MTARVDVNASVLTWALARARQSISSVPKELKAFPKWLTGASAPTLNQLEKLAAWTHTPLGYFFLDTPPHEVVPIPDFRTVNNQTVAQPSPDLLDTIHLCQIRQEWYREYAIAEDFEPLAFVGSMSPSASIQIAAEAIREHIKWNSDARQQCSTIDVARRDLIDRIEDLGVLVMVNGVVGSNTRRTLDPQEFRGLALVDDLAPLIFVNGADSKSAQIFTLVHELAHIWAGDSALSDANLAENDGPTQEIWANRVAAEVLVPSDELAETWANTTPKELALRFKVSELVILRSAFDARLIEWDEYRALCTSAEKDIAARLEAFQSSKGGDYYRSQPYRVSRRFVRAVITDTREGRTLYRDAYQLLGVAKHSTFENLAERMFV